MEQHVRQEIVNRIHGGKYFGYTLDSTSDQTHVDQLAVVVQYLEGENPVERFLDFLDNIGHGAQDIFNNFMAYLEKNSIDIADCRGQSYDNGSAFTGKSTGVQARVLAINPQALFVPCTGHSLALVGSAATECCTPALHFFIDMQALYNFFLRVQSDGKSCQTS